MRVYLPHWKLLVVLGLASGLIQVLAGLVMYASGMYFALWSALVNLALLLACIVGGVAWYVTRILRAHRTYLIALSAGVVITACTALVYMTYNIVSITLVYPHFLDDMARAFATAERPTLGRVVTSNLRAFCLWGTILSVLTAFAFRKPHPQ